MLDIQLIEDTIEELEQDATSFENCEKLTYLYICRDNYYNRSMKRIDSLKSKSEQSTQSELNDLLPAYQKYIDTKRRYQQYEVVEQMLIYSMDNLCDEITEFISSLYHNTESTAERTIILKMINEKLRSAI